MSRRIQSTLVHLMFIAVVTETIGFQFPTKNFGRCQKTTSLSRCQELYMAGGFGGTKSNNKDKKVRTISKNAPGSGTKPLRVAANTFDAIYKESNRNPEIVVDVYVRSPSNDEEQCWFVGKVARRTMLENCDGSSVPTIEEALLSQKRLILEYAQHLRPQNLGGPFSKNLQVLYARGNSELDVVQNKEPLTPLRGSTTKDISSTFSVKDVGYNPEIYVGDEIKDGGLRVKRDKDGNPVKQVFEINAKT